MCWSFGERALSKPSHVDKRAKYRLVGVLQLPHPRIEQATIVADGLNKVFSALDKDKRTDGGHIVLIGGDSRAAQAIAARLAGRPIISVVRRNSGVDRVVVDDYSAPPPGIIRKGSVVINCVGTSIGDAATLARVNVEVPRRWAIASRDAGAGHFIQLSSFSIYGAVAMIDRETPLRPVTAYGRSKMEAERVVSEASNGRFPVAMLRIPILVDSRGQDKLGTLISACRRFRVVPTITPPVRRSMLSYDGLAACVASVVASEATSRVAILADPDPFSYDMIPAAALEHGFRMASIPIPGPFIALLKLFRPATAQRLFTSSVVCDDANLAICALPFERVAAIIDAAFAHARLSNQ